MGLTFDDGPDPESTPRLLDELEALAVTATFFVLASEAERHPELTRSIEERGHQLASHGFEHVDHHRSSPREIMRDVVRARGVLESITGSAPALYRPAFGNVTLATRAAAARTGARLLTWSVDPYDWEPGISSATVAERVLGGVSGGSIVLLHDSGRRFRQPTAQPPAIGAIGEIVTTLRARGLHPGPVGGRAHVS